MDNPQVDVTPTLLERLASVTRVEWLAGKLPSEDVHSPYLYVAVFIFLDFAVVNPYSHLTGGVHAVVRNPFYIAFYLSIAIAVVGVRYMHRGHVDAISRLTERGICDAATADDYAVTIRTKLLFYGVGLVGFFAYQVFVIGIETVLETQGVGGIVFTLVLLPACYLPVAIDFVSEYATLHILLPRWLSEQDIGLFFFDPQNMGGFQPIGTLLKNSYYFYTAGLLLYLAFFYGLFVTPLEGRVASPPGAAEASLFTGLWLFGLATLSYSIYKIHRIMTAEREARLRDIESELHDVIDNPHDISNAEITDPDRLDALEYRLDQIRATSEYPTTFTMWTQIGVSVLLPQVLQLTLQATL
ncbi:MULTISPECIES: hypothetical protein [Salinibaculum]|uniref:hypothetical protein n=1 Tax=Salinibaculum TaxID=2732368 RepID=UPI0030D40D6D